MHRTVSAFIPMVSDLRPLEFSNSPIQTIRTNDYLCIHAQLGIWKMPLLGCQVLDVLKHSLNQIILQMLIVGHCFMFILSLFKHPNWLRIE